MSRIRADLLGAHQFGVDEIADTVNDETVNFLDTAGAVSGHADLDVVPVQYIGHRAAVPAGQRHDGDAALVGGPDGP